MPVRTLKEVVKDGEERREGGGEKDTKTKERNQKEGEEKMKT